MYPYDPHARRWLDLELRLRDGLRGLEQFTLDAAHPNAWLTVELLAPGEQRRSSGSSATVLALRRGPKPPG